MVGIFTIALIGLATIYDLWELLDLRRKHSLVGLILNCRLISIVIFGLDVLVLYSYLCWSI
jgi:dolichyl-phosphate-mannose--protein O-mannosyl transferase